MIMCKLFLIVAQDNLEVNEIHLWIERYHLYVLLPKDLQKCGVGRLICLDIKMSGICG
jgi:hypothetical protein